MTQRSGHFVLSELFGYLEHSVKYPIELDAVIEEHGHVIIEAPDASDSETIESIIGPLNRDSFESPEDLFNTIYGNVSDDFIGRKFYDDRGDNPAAVARQFRDDEDISF